MYYIQPGYLFLEVVHFPGNSARPRQLGNSHATHIPCRLRGMPINSRGCPGNHVEGEKKKLEFFLSALWSQPAGMFKCLQLQLGSARVWLDLDRVPSRVPQPKLIRKTAS